MTSTVGVALSVRVEARVMARAKVMLPGARVSVRGGAVGGDGPVDVCDVQVSI